MATLVNVAAEPLMSTDSGDEFDVDGLIAFGTGSLAVAAAADLSAEAAGEAAPVADGESSFSLVLAVEEAGGPSPRHSAAGDEAADDLPLAVTASPAPTDQTSASVDFALASNSVAQQVQPSQTSSGKGTLTKTITVGSQAELYSALKAAKGGETILLKDGDYGHLDLKYYNFSDFVTLKSVNSGGAVINSTYIRYTNNLRFDDITFAYGQSWWINYVMESSNIEFLNSEVFNTLAGGPDGNRLGFFVAKSNQVKIHNNKIHDLAQGIGASICENVEVVGNEIYHYSGDAMQVNIMTNFLIENNKIYNQRTQGDIHADFIQFVALSGVPGSKNVVIRGNFLYEGDGGHVENATGTQAIFIQNKSTEVPSYENFLIENNVISNSSTHGITIEDRGAKNFIVRNNVVIKNTKLPGAFATNAEKPAIAFWHPGGTGIQIYNNVATNIYVAEGNQASVYNNIITQWTDPTKANYYDTLFVDAFSGLTPQDFLPKPGSAIDFGKGLGAEQLLASLEKPAVYIVTSTPAAGLESYKVTLSALPYPGGKMPSGPVTYRWDFGDGTVATGKTVTHEFKSAGARQVAVTVGGTSGTETVDQRIAVINPLAVDVAFNNALSNGGGAAGTLSWTGAPSYLPGKEGAAANFEANGASFVRLTGAGGDISGMTQLTLSFDFRVDAKPAASANPIWLHGVYGISVDNANNIRFFLGTNDGGASPVINANVPQAFDGKWHTLTATYDGLTGVATLFLDGKVIGQKTGIPGRVSSTTRDLTIGTDSWGKNFDGQIDNLRIYRGVVPPAEEPKVLDSLRNRKGAGLYGDDGENLLAGAEGDDTLSGGGGNDTLIGGAGADWLVGGPGRDIFRYNQITDSTPAAPDTIAGFDGAGDAPGDVIDISALGTFTFIGTAAFSGPGQLRVQQAGANVLAQIDVDGDGKADWQVVIEGAVASAFVAADFVSAAPPATGATAANDLLVGTEGNDTIDGLAGDDTIEGRGGNDRLIGNVGNDELHGGEGDDTLVGGPGNDTLNGGPGFDTADYSASVSAVTVNLQTGTAFGEGRDVLISIEAVIGSAFADMLIGNDEANLLVGGAGNDTLVGGPGDDTLDGGAGLDTVDYSKASSAVSVNLQTGIATGEGTDILAGVETILGSAFADLLIGDGAANVLVGNAGNDTLIGGGGNDTLAGGPGDDVLDGGPGVDTVTYANSPGAVIVDLRAGTAIGEGNDTLISIEQVTGSAFNDWIIGNNANNWITGGAGDDTLEGGGGFDTVSFADAPQGVIVNLLAGTASGHGNDVLSGFETVNGSPFNDWIIGDNGPNMLMGGAGDDVLDGGAGNDTLVGGPGNDTLIGGSGIDTAHYGSAFSGVTVNLAAGWASGEGEDVLSSIEVVIGSNFADVLIGDGGNNTLNGGAGNDVLEGGAGNDLLIGGFGNDTLVGGPGRDTLEGGAGADVFRFGRNDGNDEIRDFQAGTDVIELRGFDIQSWQELAALMVQGNGFTTIWFSPADTLKLNGVAIADLSATDFVFAS